MAWRSRVRTGMAVFNDALSVRAVAGVCAVHGCPVEVMVLVTVLHV